MLEFSHLKKIFHGVICKAHLPLLTLLLPFNPIRVSRLPPRALAHCCEMTLPEMQQLCASRLRPSRGSCCLWNQIQAQPSLPTSLPTAPSSCSLHSTLALRLLLLLLCSTWSVFLPFTETLTTTGKAWRAQLSIYLFHLEYSISSEVSTY